MNVSTMSTLIKKTLKQKLAALVPEWNGRVQDVPAQGEVLAGPCAIIAFAEEVPKSTWAGYRRIIKISPYARLEDGGAEQVEAWSAKLIDGLHQIRLEDEAGESFTCIYLGSRDTDQVDAGSGMITRSLRFGVYIPESKLSVESLSVMEDSWLNGLQGWTQRELGSSWSVYGEAWPGGYAIPSVLWRLAGHSTSVAGTSALEVRKQWIGHVLTGNPIQTRHTVTRLVEQLAVQSRIAVTVTGSEEKEGSTRYVTVDEVTADLQTDAYLNGQIRLTLQQRIRRPSTNAPYMREIHHSKGLE